MHNQLICRYLNLKYHRKKRQFASLAIIRIAYRIRTFLSILILVNPPICRKFKHMFSRGKFIIRMTSVDPYRFDLLPFTNKKTIIIFIFGTSDSSQENHRKYEY